MAETLQDQHSIDALEKTLDLIAHEQKTGIPNTEREIYSNIFNTGLENARQQLDHIYNSPSASEEPNIDQGILDNYAAGESFTVKEGETLEAMRGTQEYQLASEKRYKQARQSPSNMFQDGTTGRTGWEAPANSNEGITLGEFWQEEDKEKPIHDKGSLGEFWQKQDESLKNRDLKSSISDDGLDQAMESYLTETAQHEGEKQGIVQLLTPLKPKAKLRDRLYGLFNGK